MQQFDRLARGGQLRLRAGQVAKLGAVFNSIAPQDYAGFREHFEALGYQTVSTGWRRKEMPP